MPANLSDLLNMTDAEIASMDDGAMAQVIEEVISNQEEPPAQEESTTQEPDLTSEGDEGPKVEGEAAVEGAEGDDTTGDTPVTSDLSDDEIDKAPEKPVEKKTKKPKSEKTEAAPVEGEKPKTEGEDGKPTEEADKDKEETPPAEDAAQLDHKSEYEKIIGVPITANGRKITLKNTDEAIRLIQQGAGYAQKMEALKPARKSAAMLEAAGLLGNEAALAQMIDLYNGDPKAIAKMVKDLKIDIFSLDLEAGEQYTPESHIQSDAAVTFTDTLKEIRNLEGGQEALTLIDKMDTESKNLLWGSAEAIKQIYDLKRDGTYDTIATELERRKALGQIPVDLPYIVAFQRVGEDMAKALEAQASTRTATEQTRNPPVAEPAKPAPRAPVATGAAPRKPEAPNAQAAAAAAPRTGTGRAKPVTDIYQLTDADIEKMSGPPV